MAEEFHVYEVHNVLVSRSIPSDTGSIARAVARMSCCMNKKHIT